MPFIYITHNPVIIATRSLPVLYRLLALRSTRAEMQAGQQAAKAASLARREASASITMMALVTIYVVVHGQSAIWWVCNTVWTRYWPTSPMVMILYALTVFTVVSPKILMVLYSNLSNSIDNLIILLNKLLLNRNSTAPLCASISFSIWHAFGPLGKAFWRYSHAAYSVFAPVPLPIVAREIQRTYFS